MHDGFSVSLYTPIGRRMTIVISDDPSLWPSGIFETYYPGLLYFAVPQRSLFVGPVPLPRRLAHGNPDARRLEDIESRQPYEASSASVLPETLEAIWR
jgi:hypothetical protein